MAIEKLTKLELAEKLANVKGAGFIGMILNTPVKLNKKHRDTKEPTPYNNLTKLAKVHAMTCFDYDKVNEARGGSAGDKPSYHRPIMVGNSYSPLAEHIETGQVYIRYEEKKSRYKYRDNGQTIKPEAVYPYMPPKKEKTDDDKAKVNFRLVKLDNVKLIRIKGKSYRIID